jgi:uncharacterized tellurite resistance protein B-like protein
MALMPPTDRGFSALLRPFEDLHSYEIVCGQTPSSPFMVLPQTPQAVGLPMQWVSSGQSIKVHGITISRGMVYFGMSTAPKEPSLINPALSISSCWDKTAKPLPWGQTYTGLSPVGRHRYLEWLADGARAPIDIGYVFLYFFGLERRLLLDEAGAGPEASALLAEIDRLAAIFGRDNHSFQFYSRGLRDYIQLRYHAEDVSEEVPETGGLPAYDLPFLLRYGLGRFVRDQQDVPVEWALRWALIDRSIQRRTPVDRCREVFERAFSLVYEVHCGDSMLLYHMSKIYTPLVFTYGGASPAWRLRPFRLEWEDIPDVVAVECPREYLQYLVEEATSRIDLYSRFVSRNPEKANTLQAHLLLSYSLWPESIQERFRELRAVFVEPMEPLTCADLFARLGRPEPPTAQMVADLATALQRLAIGMEPDILAGARRPIPNDGVVLFPLQFECEKGERTTEFTAMSLAVLLASKLAAASGVAMDAKLKAMNEKIVARTDLTPDQQMRLRAKYKLGVRQPSSWTKLKADLRELSQDQRLEVALSLSDLARAAGAASSGEVRFLEQLYLILELDRQLVYDHLHGTSVGKVPLSSKNSPNMALDPKRMIEIKRDTEVVSSLLADVFAEEESDTPVTAPSPSNVAPPSDGPSLPLLPGLNSSHNGFLAILLTRPEWSRADLEAAAREKQIMLDGAMESINDAALEAFGTILLEGDNRIYIQRDLMGNAAA